MSESKSPYLPRVGIFGSWIPIMVVFTSLILTTGYLILKLYMTTNLLVQTTRKSFIQDIDTKGQILEEFVSQRFNDLDSLSNSSVFFSYYHSKSLGMSKQYGLMALASQIENELDQRIESLRDMGQQVFLAGVYYDFEDSEILAKSNVNNFTTWMGQAIFDGIVSSKSSEATIEARCENSICRIFVTKPVIYDHQERGLLILELSAELLSQRVRDSSNVPAYESYGLVNDKGAFLVAPPAVVCRNVKEVFGLSVDHLGPHLVVDARKWTNSPDSQEVNLFSQRLNGVGWTVFKMVPDSVFGGGPSASVWMTWFFLFLLSVILLIALVLRSLRLRSLMFRRLKYAHDELEHRVQERTAALASTNDELKIEVRERKQAQKRLYQQAQVLASITDSILIISKDLKIIFANEAARDIFNLEGIGGTSDLFCHQVLKHDVSVCEDCPVKGVMEDEKAHKAVTSYIGRHGEELWVYNHAFPYYDDSGELLGAILLSTDYSIRMEIEQALNRAKEHAEAASVSKSEFLMRMSHEIRTPMYAVLGTLDLILDSDAEIQHRDLLLNAKLSAESLQGILNDILDFSKMEANRLGIETREFSLRLLVESVMDTMSLRANEKKVELVTHYLCDAPDMVHGDELRIRQILMNLLGNSLKFTSRGEVCLKVERNDETAPGEFVFEVTDSGIGIAPEKLEKIFDPFDQAEGFIARKYGGTGLGLAITKSLVELMGGRIWVESEIDKGSSFRFSLPLELSHTSSDYTDDCRIVADGDRMLIVDDNEKSGQVLRLNFESLGFYTVLETDPSKVQALMSEASDSNKPFEFILVDYEMPETNGLTILQSVEKFHRTKRVLISNFSQLDAEKKARELGINLFLRKPFKYSDIIGLFNTSADVSGQGKVVNKAEKPSCELSKEPTVSDKQRKILLAEDNAVNQKLIQRTLERQNFSVKIVGNGREAFDAFKDDTFDLVLMDVQMPILDGLSATKLIREYEKNSETHTPIVAMTAHAFEETQQECAEAGMDHYFSKPISGKALIERIEAVLKSGTVSCPPTHSA